MEKYQSYKPSGVELIGDVPVNWIVTKFNRYVFFQEGPGLRTFQFTEDGTKVICVTNITEKGIDFTYKKFISNDEYLEKYQHFTVNKGDLLLSSSGNSWGKVSEYLDDEKVMLNTSTIRLNTLDSKRMNKVLIKYILKSEFIRTQLDILMTGSCQPNFGPSHLNQLIIPIPPLHEQHQIVQFLDSKTELIDKLISTKERKITLLKEQRTSLINEVVTKGLNPNVKMKDSGVEWIGEIPEGWVVSKLKFVSEIVTGNTPSKTDGGDYYTDEGFLWIKPTYLKGDKYVNDSDEKLTELGKKQTRVIPKDSIMICCIGNTIGKYGMSGQEVSTNQQINSVIPNKSKITPWYCLYFVDVFTRDLLNRSNFVTLPILTKSDLENIEIIIPTLEEQVCIVEIINSKTKEIDDMVQLEQKKIDLLKEYRQSLISEVVTGKIKVTN